MGAAATATASASASTASGSPAPHYTKYIDAFHSQLLVDVQAIGDAVDQHVTALPLAYAEFDERARGISGAASKATTDFEAMGVALLNIIKTRTDRLCEFTSSAEDESLRQDMSLRAEAGDVATKAAR